MNALEQPRVIARFQRFKRLNPQVKTAFLFRERLNWILK